MAVVIKYREYLLATNEFKEPTVIKNERAIATNLTRLILMEPGTDPLHPTMGVGIVSKFRYLYPDAESSLIKAINDQIKQFLPLYQCSNISLIYNPDKTVDIQITIDDTIFIYESSKIVPITLATLKSS